MIKITHISTANGQRSKAEPYNREVPDLKAIELLRDTEADNRKVDRSQVYFNYINLANK